MTHRALLLLLSACLIVSAQTRKVTDAEVNRVHRSALLIDTHNDVTSATLKGFDIAGNNKDGQTDVTRLRTGGVGAVFFAAYVSADYVKDNHAAQRALEMIDTVRYDIIEKHPREFQFARTAAEIEAAHKQGKIASLIGIEGGHAIENNLRLLRQFYNLGVRYMTLTHSNTNDWADSSGDAPKHNGLTAFGKEVVAEMNRLGMMVDISHVADKTFWDVMEVTKAPVIASHSSCRALSSIARNMTDDMIARVGKNGGVVQINFGCEFLSQKSADSSSWTGPEVSKRFKADLAAHPEDKERIEKEYAAKVVRATLPDVVAHIEHVVKVAGIDHVGIGSDFDGVSCTPDGLDDNSKFPALTRALLERGFTAAQIRQIYGGNLLRVMRAVEKAAAH